MALSRRDFLKVGGSACIVAGAGAALAGCSPNGGQSNDAKPAEGGADASVVGYEPVSFDKETDILIIGTGYAGLAAAMAPALAGKKIVLAEKQQMMGGDSAGSCCFMFANGTQLQLRRRHSHDHRRVLGRSQGKADRRLRPVRLVPRVGQGQDVRQHEVRRFRHQRLRREVPEARHRRRAAAPGGERHPAGRRHRHGRHQHPDAHRCEADSGGVWRRVRVQLPRHRSHQGSRRGRHRRPLRGHREGHDHGHQGRRPPVLGHRRLRRQRRDGAARHPRLGQLCAARAWLHGRRPTSWACRLAARCRAWTRR